MALDFRIALLVRMKRHGADLMTNMTLFELRFRTIIRFSALQSYRLEACYLF